MAEEKGVLHQKIKFNDRVYLVDQIDDLLAKQRELIDAKQDKIPDGTFQKKLVPGKGIEILNDGTINCVVSRAQSNLCPVHSILLDGAEEHSIVTVSDDYHIYRATYSTAMTGPFKFKNLVSLAGSSVYEIELWVEVLDETLDVTFEPYDSTKERIVLVGDTEYNVEQAGQTLYFAVRHFNGVTFINKYFVG